tara:strand:- start:2719 stop:3975 length:1257 start_codon:yes stop_codon:yes gene_type:complete
MEQKYENWGEYRDALLEGLGEKQTSMMKQMMESVHTENIKALSEKTERNSLVVESTAPGSTVTSNISRYDMMFMPLVRRTMPALLAMDLVGFQPLNGPRGIVRTLRMRYSQDTETTSGSGVNAVAAGSEASGKNVFDKYSLLALGDDYDAVDNLDPFEQTVYLEGNRGKPMDLEVLTQAVEPKSRKLSAAYSLEAADDLSALDGLDIESELSQTLGDEIMRELDRELLGELVSLAGTVESFDFANVDGRYAGEKLAAMTIAIDNLSAQIAMKTRKSGATWMVVSQRVFTGLKNAANSSFVPVNSLVPANGGAGLQIGSSLFVGTFAGTTRVYVDPYAESDYILMGYKGSEIDTGFVYAPYIPLSSSGVVRNPETGDFRVMLRTRYALHSFTDTNTSLGDSPDYYARATVSNLELGFTN